MSRQRTQPIKFAPRPRLTERDRKAIKWVSSNRGVMSAIARALSPPVSAQYVHMVLRGKRKSHNGVVERALREKGAPI